jgi:LuxR family transcriptional regulator, maltose regulon positive regulatory protein
VRVRHRKDVLLYRVGREWVDNPPLAAGLATLAWIRQATGDPAGAADAMNEAARLSPGPAGVLNPVPAQQARLWLAQGDLESALRWTRDQGLGVDDEPSYGREPGYLVLARGLLAQRLTGPALSLLERLHAAAASQDRVGSAIEAGALLALARAADGDQDGATGALDTALESAAHAVLSGSSPTKAPLWRPCSPHSSRHKAPSGMTPLDRRAI